MRAGKRTIKDGRQFDYLFPKVKGQFKTVKHDAHLSDTIDLMQKVINETLGDTLALSALLEGDTIKQTCKNIWNFSFHHLQYTRDEAGKEQVRRPARSWRDRVQGVDCDCMTVFIASILLNLEIPYTIRLTKEKSPEFEHVYPVVKTQNETIILDAVLHSFNTEAPYREKKDIDMKLEFLDGIGSYEDQDLVESFFDDYPSDAEQLIVDEDLEGLMGKAEREARRDKRNARRQVPLKDRIKQGAKNTLNVVNKVNPATVLLRTGILAAMKLNVGKIARQLRFAYWDRTTAIRNNVEPQRFDALVKIKDKLENIFFGAGGKKENLKKAILSGKGNSDRKVQLNGLGSLITYPEDYDSLREILGDELFYDEADSRNLNGLGFVATGTALASASGVIGAIVALLKKIGGIFKKGSPQDQVDQVQNNSDDVEERTRKFSFQKVMNLPILKAQQLPNVQTPSELAPSMNFDPEAQFNRKSIEEGAEELIVDDSSMPIDEKGGDVPTDEKGIIAWAKKNPAIAVLGVAAVGTGLYFGVKALTKKSKSVNGLSGTRRKAKRKKTTARPPVRKKRKVTPPRRKKSKVSPKRKNTRRKTAKRKTVKTRRPKMIELG